MDKQTKRYIARTYRFKEQTYEALKRCREAMSPPPTEIALVELAVTEFVKRREEERGDAKRAVRR